MVSGGVDATVIPYSFSEAAKRAGANVLADIGKLVAGTQEELEAWLASGGVLIRFAGPRLEQGGDELLPVPLRVGGRTLGGALSWSTPQKLAPIEDTSLFAGTPVPPEVTVSRQVLAETAARKTRIIAAAPRPRSVPSSA